jgi:hypothetical protein
MNTARIELVKERTTSRRALLPAVVAVLGVCLLLPPLVAGLSGSGQRALVPNIAGFLALGLPIAMSVGRETGVNPVICALVVMMTGDAVLYYPVQSASALVIYQRGL